MTIAAAYLTSEGVVLGADSASTVFEGHGPKPVQLFNHAQKIFEVGARDTGRMGLCTWGPGKVGSVSHRTVCACLADRITPETTVEHAVNLLSEMVSAQSARDDFSSDELGYFLGGWDPATHLPRCFRIKFGAGSATIEPLKVGQFIFEGAPEMFIRAKLGTDPLFVEELQKELRARIQDRVPEFDELFTSSVRQATLLSGISGYDDLPLREAIDFCNMYLHLTIKSFKFRFGPALCGGPIELAVISTDRPFRWVRHKRFDSAVVQEDVGEC